MFNNKIIKNEFMLKQLIIVTYFILRTGIVPATDFWQPYPINAQVVTINGTDFKVDFSVFDSINGLWMNYSTPYYTCPGILITDSVNTVIGFNVLQYNSNNVLIRKGDFGVVIYDIELHQFRPIYSSFQSSAVTTMPGAFLTAGDASIYIDGYSDLGGGGSYRVFDFSIIYDIVKQEWDTIAYMDQIEYNVGLGVTNYKGGYSVVRDHDASSDDNYIIYYYDPVIQQSLQSWHSFVGSFKTTGPDLIYTRSNGVYSVSGGFYSYNPKTHYWAPGKGAPSIYFVQLRKGMIQMNNYSGIFDDSLQQMCIDSSTITATVMKDGVIAYISSNTVHHKVFSPSQRAWIYGTTSSPNPNSLTIQNGTVHWLDINGIPYKAGYNDSIGWGTFDTPLQLSFEATHAYSESGLPYVFVRNYSIGTDSVCFDFGDGTVSEYGQNSLWYLYKVNGHYQSTSSPVNYDICIKTVNDSGPQMYCESYLLNCQLPSTPVITATSTNICQNDSVIVTISGNLNHATNWIWYESGCGIGSVVGQGDTITLHPNQSSTFYVRGEGGCVTNGSCSSITIAVSPPIPHLITNNGKLSFCLGDSVQLNSLGSFASYQWYKSGYLLAGEVDPTYYAKTAGNYYCVANDSTGCPSLSNSINVRVPCIPMGPVHERIIEVSGKFEIDVFPNPSDGLIELYGPNGSLQIFNIHGQVVYEGKIIQNSSELNLSLLNPGIYLIILQSEASIYKKKLLIK